MVNPSITLANGGTLGQASSSLASSLAMKVSTELGMDFSLGVVVVFYTNNVTGSEMVVK